MARLYYLLNVAQHRLSRNANRECETQLGVTAAQLGALFVLGKRPKLRQSELAEELGCTKGAITAVTKRLSAAGLVKTSSCADDGRATRLQLSAKGRRTIEQAGPVVTELQDQLCADFSKAEMKTVVRFLETVIERNQ